jgi:hypothetical protein
MKGKEYGANSIAGKAQDRLDKLKGNGKSQSAKNIEYRNEVEKDVENGFTRGVTVTKTKR